MKDPFEILGLAPRFDLPPDELESRYRELSKILHPDRHASGTPAAQREALGRAVELNEAYRALRDDVARGEALLARRGHAVSEKNPADPRFLVEVMELREGLSDAKRAGDLTRVRALAQSVQRERVDTLARIAALLDADAPTADVAALLARLRYYRRFLDEVEVIEEDAALAG